MSQSAPLAVVFGALTRLGRAWINGPGAAGYDVLLVARHERDQERLATLYPDLPVWSGGDLRSSAIHERPRIAIIGCALGLIHHERPDWKKHSSEAQRDIEFLVTVLDGCTGVPAHLVYVSSILAQAPRGTAWYGGWKNVIEDAVSTAVADHPSVRMSVLFPGQMIGSRGEALPLSLLHTPFADAAGVIATVLAADRPVRRLIGLDARLWLALRSVSALVRAVVNRF